MVLGLVLVLVVLLREGGGGVVPGRGGAERGLL